MLRSFTRAQRSHVTLALALLFAALPAAAQAQETTKTRDTTENFPISGNNPCFNNEFFEGTGTLQTREESSPNKFKFRSQTQGQAASATAPYDFLDIFEREVITTAKRFTDETETLERFIRKGAPKDQKDDFFQRTRHKEVTNNGETVVTRDEVRRECK